MKYVCYLPAFDVFIFWSDNEFFYLKKKRAGWHSGSMSSLFASQEAGTRFGPAGQLGRLCSGFLPACLKGVNTVCLSVRLYVCVCQPCDRLATCSECILSLT